MNIHWIGIALSATLGSSSLGNVALAQNESQETAPSTAPEAPATLQPKRFPEGRGKQTGDLPGQAPRGFSEVERAQWRRALALPDLDQRLGFYLQLVERAAKDPSVEELLIEWAQDTDHLELAWSARLGLREARSMRVRDRRNARRTSDLFAGLTVHLGELPQGIMVADPRGNITGMRNGRSSSRILRLQAGPAGVRVEVRNTGEAGPRTDVFEALDMEQLLEQHPELARDLANARLVPAPGGSEAEPMSGDTRVQMEFSFDALWSGDAGLLRTDILGIQMREQRVVPEGEEQGTPPVGLLVERVLHDTIAEVIALRRGDLLLELNSVSLLSGDDVSRIFQGREAAGAIILKLERDGSLRTLTWKPTIAVDASGGTHRLPPVDLPEPVKPATDGE